MGFFVMVFSMLLGILLVFIAMTKLRKSNKKWAFALILFAVWLGWPK